MQVPQVTEEAALAVIELYPTPFFLAQAYSTLVGPLCSFSLFSFTIRTVTHTKNKSLIHCTTFLILCVPVLFIAKYFRSFL